MISRIDSNTHNQVANTQRKQSLCLFLKLSASFLFILALINSFFLPYLYLGLSEFILSLLCLVLLYLLKTPRQYIAIANTYVLVSAFSIIALILFFNLESSTFVWLGLLPIIAFNLLGAKKGIIVHAVFSITFLLLMFSGLHNLSNDNTATTYTNLITYLMVSGVFCYFYEVQKAETIELFHQYSYIDQLTKMGNRKMFDEILAKEIASTKRYNKPLSIIMTDIDYFKSVNDSFGHLTGDTVLIEFAQLLKKNIRHSDSISRWGGEEFIILLPNHSAAEATVLANNLKHAVANFPFHKIQHLTASFGVTEFLSKDNTATFLSRLDAALYQAKEEGRDKVITI